MKNYATFYVIALFFLTVNMNAQQMRPRSERGGGIDQTSNKPKKQKDFIEVNVDYLEKELTLDTFQKAAVLSIFNSKREALTSLSTSEMHEEERNEKAKVIMDKIDSDIMKLLTKTQAEKYQKILDDKEKKSLKN